ncbi:alpha/beta fold hydrolase [Sphingosinicella ginsenosidimutans]|uniref:Alpha/beta hydrolase n=1 Tax=Allosphingosinicella ginsenosidimutans TaxID=1176539 RepID=A0A5C6TSA2_9SPHN|nr:alpha/beta hydrolase [Sphingosinicella ginsenosidimutans]TXC63089.1 alpha/beta hydrolase [Sphingosinicella ginsenosidimutans]
MLRLLLAAMLIAFAAPCTARVAPFPAAFSVRDVDVGGATLHVRVGGHGPAVLLLHGFGDTGDMWQPLAVRLMADHTVIVPDLRGMGLSSHPDDGYDKKSQAEGMARMLHALGQDGPLAVVTHDIGNMVGYAFIAENRDRVTRWVVMDAPLPGIGHWDDQYRNPKTWHFNFRGPDVERLVAGRERILLDRFYNDLSADPSRIDDATRQHYAALYARPRAIHDAFEQFAAFNRDGADNQAFLAQGPLAMPVLAIGGDHSYGAVLATEIGFVASNVRPLVIANSGHWLMEEQPDATVNAILAFLNER